MIQYNFKAFLKESLVQGVFLSSAEDGIVGEEGVRFSPDFVFRRGGPTAQSGQEHPNTSAGMRDSDVCFAPLLTSFVVACPFAALRSSPSAVWLGSAGSAPL